MNEKFDPHHIATIDEFNVAMVMVPILRKQCEEEQDYYQRIVLKVKLGEQILNITSYLYGLTLKDCEEFSEIVSYWVTKKLQEKRQQITDLEKLL